MIRVAILLVASIVSARAAGFQDVMAPDPGRPPIEIGIWYPSDDPASSQPLELYRQTVAPGGAVQGGAHPMVVISHGQGGSLAGHYDTALALAAAGYLVVAPTHTGDNWRDQSNVLNPMDRVRQISQVLDYMLNAWPGRASVDPARIGIFGYSIGGFTALVALGGAPDLNLVRTYCGTHSADFTCTLVADHAGDRVDPPVPPPLERRLRAAVIAAPALAFTFLPDGLRTVTVPIQLWRADEDQILPPPDHADAVHKALPAPPDFQTVANAGHFDFLAPCSAALAARVPIICQEQPGFDRAAFHERLNAAIVAFFNRTLE